MRSIGIALKRFRGSHMEIDSEEKEAPRDENFSTLDLHPSNDQDKLVETTEPMDRLEMLKISRVSIRWIRSPKIDYTNLGR